MHRGHIIPDPITDKQCGCATSCPALGRGSGYLSLPRLSHEFPHLNRNYGTVGFPANMSRPIDSRSYL